MKFSWTGFVSLQTADLWPDLEEHSVPDQCPEVQSQISDRAASDGQQAGGLRHQSSPGPNKEPNIRTVYNRVSPDIYGFWFKSSYVFNISAGINNVSIQTKTEILLFFLSFQFVRRLRKADVWTQKYESQSAATMI